MFKKQLNLSIQYVNRAGVGFYLNI